MKNNSIISALFVVFVIIVFYGYPGFVPSYPELYDAEDPNYEIYIANPYYMVPSVSVSPDPELYDVNDPNFELYINS